MAHSRFLDDQEGHGNLLLPIQGYKNCTLLPLEEAVKPLTHLCENLLANVWIIKKRCETIVDNVLSIDESASIQLYTTEWLPSENTVYYQLNHVLRSKERVKLISPWLLYLKLFLTALFKLESVQTVIWRGIRGNFSNHYPEGKEIIWWGFSSCTQSIKLLELDQYLGKDGDRTLFNIQCLKGKQVQKYSYYSENEVLLMPGTYLQVVDTLDAGNGLHVIHLRELIPPHELLQPPFSVVMKTSEPEGIFPKKNFIFEYFPEITRIRTEKSVYSPISAIVRFEKDCTLSPAE
ncbi:unnamed protein product [Didymodactylos carnosus]|uniref:NAD(P)(+)--arginine ADP-ribosyltransferase n=1 Tax=Didymodactylos carnosus TaxID=1234261 RepID=A0A815CHS4_9BILA|nr:unnamed protein product [Didymodactylos carnosus]CAF1283825.1 unnamed protein product [Didymodactylos carnosus]CAF3872949.1 unnamed protein product [Didymodactylos carnosus]CAF4081631.1 unnamed protein product [Didymodactylos carnosus]